MDDTVQSCLTDGAEVHVIIRPDAWTLREVGINGYQGETQVIEGNNLKHQNVALQICNQSSESSEM